jgi:Glycosyl transferase family 2
VDDAGPSKEARALAARFGARYEPHAQPLGLNVARNTGVERSTGELVVFVDDDVEVCEGWLDALLAAARAYPAVDVFTGPILARLEGSPPHSCGRERPPITTLDLGPEDTPTRYAWGANMAIRRAALERVGPFDVSLEHGGDEQEWQERLRAGHVAGGHRDGAAPENLTDSAPTEAPPNDATPERATPGAITDGAAPENLTDSATPGPTTSEDRPVLYVSAAKLYHRRSPADARLRSLCAAAFARGKGARRFDAWRGLAPSLGSELATLVGCLGHVVRYRCPAGLTMLAHSAGRTREAVREQTGHATTTTTTTDDNTTTDTTTNTHTHTAAIGDAQRTTIMRKEGGGKGGASDEPRIDDFLSGESGTVGGLDGARRATLDIADEALEIVCARRLRLDIAARRARIPQRVLALCVARPEHRALVERIRVELARSRHEVELCLAAAAQRGKFENLNLLLDNHPAEAYDWLLVVDDDIVLPRGFLDRFLFLAERFRLDLAQPAHRRASHAAWQVTRRQARSLVRETRFVEIGPVTAFARSTFSTLLPFPDLRMGWGLDMHWAALAQEHGWRCGVLDAVPIRHRAAPAASSYSREQALAEARHFLADRPHLRASEAQQTLVTHRRL